MKNDGQLDANTRHRALGRLRNGPLDVLVVGGGVTGVGTALDAVTRGLNVGLIEKDDLASGTSSRSSRMIHGGIRYLKQGRLGLVREALAERARLLGCIAPHLVQPVDFLIPVHGLWQWFQIRTGVWLYERLGGARHVPPARYLSPAELARLSPGLRRRRCIGAMRFHDALTDDARYVLMLARTAVAHGAALATGVRAEALLIEGGRVCGVQVREQGSGETFPVYARHTVSALGAWTGEFLPPESPPAPLRPSKGVHLVLPKTALKLDGGVIAQTKHGLLFIIPWQGHWLIGDTDTPWQAAPDAVSPAPEDVDMLLTRLHDCCHVQIEREQILGIFAGLRPLVASHPDVSTTALSREHRIESPLPGWTRISGGKFTTYRVMAEQLVNTVMRALGEEPDKCSVTASLPLLGAKDYTELWAKREQLGKAHGLTLSCIEHLLRRYGDRINDLFCLIKHTPDLRRTVTGTAHTLAAEIVYACTHEGARHVADVLERRTRIALHTPHHGQAALEEVLALMQAALDWSDNTTAQERAHYLRQVRQGDALHPPTIAAHLI